MAFVHVTSNPWRTRAGLPLAGPPAAFGTTGDHYHRYLPDPPTVPQYGPEYPYWPWPRGVGLSGPFDTAVDALRRADWSLERARAVAEAVGEALSRIGVADVARGVVDAVRQLGADRAMELARGLRDRTVLLLRRADFDRVFGEYRRALGEMQQETARLHQSGRPVPPYLRELSDRAGRVAAALGLAASGQQGLGVVPVALVLGVVVIIVAGVAVTIVGAWVVESMRQVTLTWVESKRALQSCEAMADPAAKNACLGRASQDFLDRLPPAPEPPGDIIRQLRGLVIPVAVLGVVGAGLWAWGKGRGTKA